MTLFISIVAFINGITVIIVGLLAWLNNPKRKVNRLMGLMCMSVAVWAISWGIQAPIQEKTLALFWARMLNFGAIFIPIFFLHWISALLGPEKEKKNKTILILGYLLTLFFALFSFTPYFIMTVEPKPYSVYYSEPGVLHPFYLLFCYGGLVGCALYNLLRSYKKATDYKKAQIKYVLLGTILGFGGGATNYFVFYNIPIPPFGNPLIAVGFGILAYSMIRYRLMDIRWILGRTGIYLLSFMTVLLYSFSLSYLNQEVGTIIPWIGFIAFISITVILLFLYFFQFYEKIAGRYFYYTFYTLQNALKRLGEKLNQIIELDKLTTLINQSLLDSLQLDRVGIILKEPERKMLQPQQLINLKEEEISQILQKEQGFLPEYLQKQKKPLVREEIPFLIEEIKRKEEKPRSEREEKEQREERIKLSSLKEEMEKAGIALFLPLLVEEELMGVIILGNKLSQEAYTVQDLDLLTTLTSQTAVAFNNAISYSEIEKRKADLEKFYKLTVGRELRMIELKKEIERLKKEKEKL